MKKTVAVLGATGTVGQKIIKMLENHPHFEITEIAASERSVGKKYKEINWREPGGECPNNIQEMKLIPLKDVTAQYALSALPSDVAAEIEPYLASKGTHVISNASTFRMDKQTPLVIPEINSHHFELTEKQSTPGKLVTNPNCSTVFVTLGLLPIFKLAPLKAISIVTLQAISGAGYPGISSMDILGNIVPNIGGEEEKIENEAQKILGEIEKPLDTLITAHVHRVPVVHGHTVAMHLYYESPISVEQVKASYKDYQSKYPELYKLYEDEFSPQPLRDIHHFDQRAHIGRIKQGASDNIIGLVSMGHNLVRGAAGAAILNMEAFDKYLGK